MKKSLLLKIFLRSFFIHTTLNFRRMQNIGFAMTIIPLVGEWNLTQEGAEKLLNRHLQTFNTHPYFSAAVIGSVISLEEREIESREANSSEDSVAVKKVLAGPYAAIGDNFFWGALRPFAAVISCILACLGCIIAPLVFLLVYTPAHVWVRAAGFLKSYQKGKQGIEFVRALDLPRIAVKVRWLSLILLIGWTVFLLHSKEYLPTINLSDIMLKSVAIAIVTVSVLLIKRISQFYILYGAVIILFLISLKEF